MARPGVFSVVALLVSLAGCVQLPELEAPSGQPFEPIQDVGWQAGWRFQQSHSLGWLQSREQRGTDGGEFSSGGTYWTDVLIADAPANIPLYVTHGDAGPTGIAKSDLRPLRLGCVVPCKSLQATEFGGSGYLQGFQPIRFPLVHGDRWTATAPVPNERLGAFTIQSQVEGVVSLETRFGNIDTILVRHLFTMSKPSGVSDFEQRGGLSVWYSPAHHHVVRSRYDYFASWSADGLAANFTLRGGDTLYAAELNASRPTPMDELFPDGSGVLRPGASTVILGKTPATLQARTQLSVQASTNGPRRVSTGIRMGGLVLATGGTSLSVTPNATGDLVVFAELHDGTDLVDHRERIVHVVDHRNATVECPVALGAVAAGCPGLAASLGPGTLNVTMHVAVNAPSPLQQGTAVIECAGETARIELVRGIADFAKSMPSAGPCSVGVELAVSVQTKVSFVLDVT